MLVLFPPISWPEGNEGTGNLTCQVVLHTFMNRFVKLQCIIRLFRYFGHQEILPMNKDGNYWLTTEGKLQFALPYVF